MSLMEIKWGLIPDMSGTQTLRDLVRQHLPAIELRPLSVAPPRLPYYAGATYFELVREGPLWSRLETSRVLALHGLLHLLGYDHEDPTDGGRMARVEARLRSKGHLRVGLIERSSVAPAVRPAKRT